MTTCEPGRVDSPSICFVIYSLHRGGAERATVNLANHLVERGWRVAVATLAADPDVAYRLAPAVRRIVLPPRGVSQGIIDGLVANASRVRQLRAVFCSERYGIALGMSSTANVLVALACLGRQTLACGSERVHPPMEPTSQVWNLARRVVYRALDSVVCLTSDTRDWLRDNTFATCITTIPNGVVVPPVAAEPHVELPADLGTLRVALGIGRLVTQKRFDHLIKAFAAAAADLPEWRLILAGSGADRDPLQRCAREAGVADRVRFLGDVGNIADWLARADLFILSSTHEGFPNVLLEAMAMGRAVVSYDCPTGPRDLVNSGHNGTLVESGDVEALGLAMRELMLDDARRDEFGRTAAQVIDTHSMEAIGDRWADFLRGRLARRLS